MQRYRSPLCAKVAGETVANMVSSLVWVYSNYIVCASLNPDGNLLEYFGRSS